MICSFRKCFLAFGMLGGFSILNSASILAAESPGGQPRADFVRGLGNAEDLVWFSGTEWIAVSQINLDVGDPPTNFRFSPLMAVNTSSKAIVALYPTAHATNNWDREAFPDCADPPEKFSPTGINVRPTASSQFRLYVNNLGRKSIEIIDVAIHGERLQTAWRGCVHAPKGLKVWPNSVAPLPGGGIVMSGYNVAVWRPDQGWVRLDSFTARGPGEKGDISAYPDGLANGVEVSVDGERIFVADFSKKKVLSLPINSEAGRQVVDLTFFPDNLRWGDDGGLYVTGPLPQDASAGKRENCFERKLCSTPFAVSRIDPVAGVATEIYRSGKDGIDGVFGAATTALKIGSDLWIGTVHGDRIARVLLDVKTP